MNPWAFVIIGLGIMLIIIGVKGTQHDIASAVTGSAKAATQKGNSSGGGGNTGTIL